MEIIINYFVAAFKAILTIFGKEVDAEVEDNLRTMIGNLFGYEPEVKAE